MADVTAWDEALADKRLPEDEKAILWAQREYLQQHPDEEPTPEMLREFERVKFHARYRAYQLEEMLRLPEHPEWVEAPVEDVARWYKAQFGVPRANWFLRVTRFLRLVK